MFPLGGGFGHGLVDDPGAGDTRPADSDQGTEPVAGAYLSLAPGSENTSAAYQTLLKQHGMVCRMSCTGNCWANVPVERFFGSLKQEWTGDPSYRTRQEPIAHVREYLAMDHNAVRLHSTLGYRTPMDFEETLGHVSVKC